eukprot:COSAG03_NODE_7064_length_967_cov_11.799539_2_plen_58_part_01
MNDWGVTSHSMHAPRDTVLKRYRVADGIDQPLRDPSPYATPLPTRPLSLRDPSSPSPP